MMSSRGQKSQGPSSTSEASYSIRSVERVCDILDLLQHSPRSVSLSKIAQVTGMPTSSAFRYLAVLESRRYVERDLESGKYRLGFAVLPSQSRPLELLAERTKSHLERLRDRFRETVNLGVLDGHRVLYVEIMESPKAMRLSARRGDRDYIHSTALGKAIAAHLPEDQVLAILDAEGMPRLTSKTITSLDEYMTELKAVRVKGYALDHCENEPEGRCLAVPIVASHLPAAISLSAPKSHFSIDRTEEVADEFLNTTRQLTSELTGGRGRQDL